MTGSLATRPLSRALLGPFTTISLGAAAIHFGVAAAHFQEWWVFGLFMVAIGWFQALWPIAYVRRRTVSLTLIGALVNLATVGLWLWTRSVGLPFGPHPGHAEAIAAGDALATVFELVLAGGLTYMALRPIRRRSIEQRIPLGAPRAWAAIIAVVVAVSTSAAITLGM